MTYQFLVVAYGVLFVAVFAAFGMQRTTLLLSREANTDARTMALLLPAWFPAVWALRLCKWGLLIAIAASWSLGWAIGLFVLDIFLSSMLPIPYRVYVPAFRARIDQIKQANFELGNVLERTLNASSLLAR